MRYYSAPRRALRGVRQLLYPRRCPFCNAVLGSIRTCPDCAEEVDRLRRKPGIRLDASQHYLGGLSGAAAPFRYEGCVRRAILRAKYQAAPWTAVELGVVLAELAFGCEVRMRGAEPVPQRVEGARLGYDCIVPVPASSRRRGYNVPERMAQPLAEALDLPLETKALGPARRKDRQAGLPFEQRLANVAGAFRVQDPDLIEGRRVLLVDDVITTGAMCTGSAFGGCGERVCGGCGYGGISAHCPADPALAGGCGRRNLKKVAEKCLTKCEKSGILIKL